MVFYKQYLRGFLWFSLGIFLLFSSAKAEKQALVKYITLPPFWQWRMAYHCMLNETNPCHAQYKLNMSGIVIVPQEEVTGYCTRGCAEHMRVVLKCIHQWKRDFRFANKGPVRFIEDSITHGCFTTTHINTTSYSSASSMRSFKSISVPLMSVLFLIIFNM